MNPKLLIVVLFFITFAISFLIYLFVVNIITPHIDLSSTAKGNIEVAPEFNESTFGKKKIDDKISALQEKAMQDSKTYEPDISGLMQDSGQMYVPMDELQKEKGENLPGLLDKDNIGSIRVPGDDVAINTGPVTETSTENVDTTDQADVQQVGNNDGTSVDLTASTEVTFTSDKKEDTDKKETINKPVKASINRVVVGSYSSIDDAKKAYDDMITSDLDVAPIIKEIDGNYTLQVGAFSDKEKAQTMVETLNNKNYSATIVDE